MSEETYIVNEKHKIVSNLIADSRKHFAEAFVRLPEGGENPEMERLKNLRRHGACLTDSEIGNPDHVPNFGKEV